MVTIYLANKKLVKGVTGAVEPINGPSMMYLLYCKITYDRVRDF